MTKQNGKKINGIIDIDPVKANSDAIKEKTEVIKQKGASAEFTEVD